MKCQDHDGCYKEMLWESSLSHGESLNGTTLLFFSTNVAFLTVFSGCLSWLLALSGSPAISSVLEATVSLSHAFLHFLCLSPDISRRCPLPAEGLWVAQTHSWTHLCPIWTVARVGAGLVCRSLGPSMVQRFTWTSLCDCFKGICDSKELKSSPSLLQAWSPCSLLYPQTCWGFSKVPSHWLHLTHRQDGKLVQ